MSFKTIQLKYKFSFLMFCCHSFQSEFSEGVSTDLRSADPESWQQLAEAMTPSIVKVVEFAKGVPGFTQVSISSVA